MLIVLTVLVLSGAGVLAYLWYRRRQWYRFPSDGGAQYMSEAWMRDHIYRTGATRGWLE